MIGASRRKLGFKRTVDLLETVLDALPDHVFVKDREGRLLYANEACAKAFGKTKRQMAGLTDFDLFPPESAEVVLANDRTVLRTGRPRTIEEPIQLGDKRVTFATTKAPRRDRKGRVIGVFGIARDITQRKALEEALRRSLGSVERHRAELEDVVEARTAQLRKELAQGARAREALAAAEASRERERLQREFLANVSHDLCTPIAAIKGYVETLQGGVKDARTRAEFLKTIARQAASLEELVTDLLALSAIESGKEQATPEPIELSPVAREQVEGLAPVAARAGVTIRLDIPPELRVLIPRKHLERVFQNLLSNAIKYNRPRGQVALGARADDGRVRLTVRDTGIGIASGDIPLLFNRFHRTPEARKRCGGTGLGLSIVKAIVEKADGRISVESAQGKGTTFHITLAKA